jgi:hypothetical protein
MPDLIRHPPLLLQAREEDGLRIKSGVTIDRTVGPLEHRVLNLNRHAGLDPGSIFLLAVAAKEGGCRVKPGMTGDADLAHAALGVEGLTRQRPSGSPSPSPFAELMPAPDSPTVRAEDPIEAACW